MLIAAFARHFSEEWHAYVIEASSEHWPIIHGGSFILLTPRALDQTVNGWAFDMLGADVRYGRVGHAKH